MLGFRFTVNTVIGLCFWRNLCASLSILYYVIKSLRSLSHLLMSLLLLLSSSVVRIGSYITSYVGQKTKKFSYCKESAQCCFKLLEVLCSCLQTWWAPLKTTITLRSYVTSSCSCYEVGAVNSAVLAAVNNWLSAIPQIHRALVCVAADHDTHAVWRRRRFPQTTKLNHSANDRASVVADHRDRQTDGRTDGQRQTETHAETLSA